MSTRKTTKEQTVNSNAAKLQERTLESQHLELLKSNTTPLHITNFGDQVRIVKVVDTGSETRSYGFIVVHADGRIAEPVFIKRSKLYDPNSKNVFNFLLDSTAEFEKADIDSIKAKVYDIIRKMRTSVNAPSKLSSAELYREICTQCKLLEDGVKIRYEKDCIVIDKAYFAGDFLREIDSGYKCLEAQKLLNTNGLLKSNTGRYDRVVKDKEGVLYRAICIRCDASIYNTLDESGDEEEEALELGGEEQC